MSIAHALLGLLEGSSRHGYDLKQSYGRRFGATKPIRFGQVYRVLAQLERDGLVEIVSVEAGAGPDRKAVTPSRARGSPTSTPGWPSRRSRQ